MQEVVSQEDILANNAVIATMTTVRDTTVEEFRTTVSRESTPR
jgi:hypothetical protein